MKISVCMLFGAIFVALCHVTSSADERPRAKRRMSFSDMISYRTTLDKTGRKGPGWTKPRVRKDKLQIRTLPDDTQGQLRRSNVESETGGNLFRRFLSTVAAGACGSLGCGNGGGGVGAYQNYDDGENNYGDGYYYGYYYDEDDDDDDDSDDDDEQKRNINIENADSHKRSSVLLNKLLS